MKAKSFAWGGGLVLLAWGDLLEINDDEKLSKNASRLITVTSGVAPSGLRYRFCAASPSQLASPQASRFAFINI